MKKEPRLIDAGLSLLDRQIIDAAGTLAGKVDDLELKPPRSGSGPPVVTAIYAGPGALSKRLGGRLGLWIESIHRRLHHATEPGPARIPFRIVGDVGNEVTLTVAKDELEINLFDDWVRDHVIGKIPGARHASD